MSDKLYPILSRCNLTEEQFLAGIPALFQLNTSDERETHLQIIALFRDGKIFIQSDTYLSLTHYRKLQNGEYSDYNRVLSELIVVENCSTLERDLEYIKNNIIVTVPMILLMDDVNLQVVIAILMSKDTSMPNLESETTDPKSCSLISRILKCPAIDECWKAKHLSHLRPDQSALSNAHSALNQ